MPVNIEITLREELLNRRQKLESATVHFEERRELKILLREVDAALERMEAGTFGLCEVCHDPIEPERLIKDPLTQFCLDHLTLAQQRALEEDLMLASEIQHGLLPKPKLRIGEWEVSHYYEAAGPVSGDYCDLIDTKDGYLYFVVGDVSGKGIAASMLMAHLHAMFRSLISFGLPLDQIVERASRVFCESTLPSHYATLVCGRAGDSGEVELCNAGHLPPLVSCGGEITLVKASGLPLGMFSNEQFSTDKLRLSQGSTLLLYTDGLSETQDGVGTEYGRERLARLVSESHALPPEQLINTCLQDVAAFRSGAAKKDDLTIMAIRRVASA